MKRIATVSRTRAPCPYGCLDDRWAAALEYRRVRAGSDDELAPHGPSAPRRDRTHRIFNYCRRLARPGVGSRDKYSDPRVFERALSLAWTQTQVQLHHLGIGTDEAQLFQRLANAVLYSDAALRPSSETLEPGTLERASLWAHGISGDLPIVLACIDKAEDVDIVRQLLRAHEYWRMKQLSADVIILNEKTASYEQDLQGSLEALVRGSRLRLLPDTGGGHAAVFIFCETNCSLRRDRTLLQQFARVVLLSRRGTLAEQVARLQRRRLAPPPLLPSRRGGTRLDVPLPEREVEFFNGLRGFADDGREYVTILGEGLRTPRPWINVIANPSFGFVVSESGSGFTWSLNSHENQLTPWSNDPVTDVSGEMPISAMTTQRNSGVPAAANRDDPAPYVGCHGQGYRRFIMVRTDPRGTAAICAA